MGASGLCLGSPCTGKDIIMSTNLANRKPEEVAEGDDERRKEAESDKSSGDDGAAQDGNDQEKQNNGPSV